MNLMIEAGPQLLRQQAARFRRLAREILDEDAREALTALAVEYEVRAIGAEGDPKTPGN